MKLFSFLQIAVLTVLSFTACQKPNDVPVNQVPVADAGSSQTIQLPPDSASLNGSGKDSDGQVVAYAWSEVSGPNTAVILNNGAASTKIKGLIAGIYVFQLLVVDNMGATGTDTVSVTVHAAKIINLSLQPNQNPTEVHVWGNATTLEGSSPPAPEIGALRWTYNGIEVGMRALLKFDLGSIPSDATILSAKLTLYSNPTPLNGDSKKANTGLDNTTLIQRVTSTWVPNTVRWVNQPTATATDQVIIPHTAQPFLDLVNIDVSKFVSAMLSSNSNNGFLIRLQTEVIYNSRIFCSSKYADVTKHPKLVIEYTK
ncbi:MAG: DNRLRE domain-containing protein [Chitinophagaceae bacterium]